MTMPTASDPETTMTDTITLLPATEKPAPDRAWAVTGVKAVETSRGCAFVATVRLDGKIVGTLENNGNGGATSFHGKTAEANSLWRTSALAYADAIGGTDEDLGESLVEEYDTLRQIKSWAKKGTVILTGPPSLLDGTFNTLNGDGTDPRVRAFVKDNKPDARMWIDGRWQAP